MCEDFIYVSMCVPYAKNSKCWPCSLSILDCVYRHPGTAASATVAPEAHDFIQQRSGVQESMKVFAYYYVGIGCAVLLTGYVSLFNLQRL